MPINNGTIDRDSRLLSELLDEGVITLDSFTAVPLVTPPAGSVTLSWAIGVRPERASSSELRATVASVRFELDQGVTPIGDVSRVGVRVVQPIVTSDFVLFARLRQVRTPLGSVTVTVDLKTSRQFSVAESSLLSMLQNLVNEEFAAGQDFRLRGPIGLAVNRGGVSIHIPLCIRSPIGDTHVDIQSRYLLLVQDGLARVTEVDFSNPVQFPSGLELMVPVNIDTVETAIGRPLQERLRNRVREVLQTSLNEFLPAELYLYHLRLMPGEITIVACERG
jgi:hypothetical protein